jgi:uncharacterized membrane protein
VEGESVDAERSVARRGVQRLENFSDAVVAIAATLLILPLVDAVNEENPASLTEFVDTNGRALLSFVLSFLVIYRFWIVHHGLYSRLRGYSTALLWVNCLWLLSIVFLPFPTQLVASPQGSVRVDFGIYIGTMLLMTVTSLLAHLIVIRSPALQVADARAATSLIPGAAAAVALGLALALVLSAPAVGGWSLLLLLLTGPLERLFRRRRTPSASKQS